MKSEIDIRRYINILEKRNNSNLEAYNMLRALKWVILENPYPEERDLTILETLDK